MGRDWRGRLDDISRSLSSLLPEPSPASLTPKTAPQTERNTTIRFPLPCSTKEPKLLNTHMDEDKEKAKSKATQLWESNDADDVRRIVSLVFGSRHDLIDLIEADENEEVLAVLEG